MRGGTLLVVGILLGGAGVVALNTGFVTVNPDAINGKAPLASQETPTPTPEGNATWEGILSTKTPAPTESKQTGELNRTRLEHLIHTRINEVRANHSLRQLNFDPGLHKIARYHSEDMATQGYYSHDSPSGETMGDRYDKFGYECRAGENDGDGQIYSGAENIHKLSYQNQVRDDGEIEYVDSPEQLADEFVEDWMQSPGHRENILQEFWDDEAIGVAITEEDGVTYVYATQNFC